jgi:hypothetical protein
MDTIALWAPAEYTRVYESLFEELPDDSPQVVGPTPPTTPPPRMGVWASSSSNSKPRPSSASVEHVVPTPPPAVHPSGPTVETSATSDPYLGFYVSPTMPPVGPDEQSVPAVAPSTSRTPIRVRHHGPPWMAPGITRVEPRQPWETFQFTVADYKEVIDACHVDPRASMELFQLAQLECGGRDAANNIVHKLKKSLHGGRGTDSINNYSAWIQSQCVAVRHKLMWWMWTPTSEEMGYVEPTPAKRSRHT